MQDEAKTWAQGLKYFINENYSGTYEYLQIRCLAYEFLGELGDSDAQYDAGVTYLHGDRGTYQNFQKGEEWLKKAGAQGDEMAYYQLFNYYVGQYGSSFQNLAEATQCLEKIQQLSAKRTTHTTSSVSEGMRELMSKQLQRKSEENKLEEERYNFEELAKQEDATPQAKYNVGMNFFESAFEKFRNPNTEETKEILQSNKEKAERWFKEAAKKGDAASQDMLVAHYGYEKSFFTLATEEPSKNSPAQVNIIPNTFSSSNSDEKEKAGMKIH